MKWKPYPEYKDSGIPWLGEIPANWKIRRLKYVSSCNDESLTETTEPDFELLYVDIGNVDQNAGILTKEQIRFESAPSRARRKVQHGDVIVSTVRTYLRAIAPIVHPEPNLIVSTGFAVIRPKDGLENTFAAYALRAPYFVDTVVANSVGVSYPAINASDLITLPIALPPPDEQFAIAAFLDRETARIDALIEKKQKQIELLQEKRTVVISRAVTKGLDPNVKMKDSGIPWLGEIPAHWAERRLRYCAVINPSKTETSRLPEDARVSFVPMEALEEMGGLRLEQTKTLDEVSTGYTYFRDGDVLVAKITPCFENGKGAIAQELENGIGFGTTELHVLRPGPDIDRRFLFYLTLSNAFRGFGTGSMYGAGGQKRVSDDFIRNFRHPIPPLATQRAIAAFLDRETARIDALIEKIRQSIDKLREYRTALISAAVTGKMDVREEAA